MRRSIATVSLSGTLPEKLEAIAAAGFEAVEIFENDLLYYTGSARSVREMAAGLGLEIALFQPFRDFEAVPEEQFRRNLERAERKFDLMGELGAPLILVCSNVQRHAIGDPALSAAQLHALAERAAARDIRIGFEALAWGTHTNRYGQAWSIVQQADHPSLGVILDSFHSLAIGDDAADMAAIPGEKIFFVQLADAPRMTLDPLSWSRHFRCFPGQGDLDVAGFLAGALKAGYAGPISLEIFNDDFRAAPTRQTAADGMRSLLFLEEQVGLPGRARPDLFAPPPAPRLGGVAFLEFAVDVQSDNGRPGDEHSGAELGQMLERLGFARAGRHRTKDVTLYRQGDISIILNAEPDSFAHSYYLFHGPSACAIGLWAADVKAALARAEAYGCARFEGQVGPNELNIPAIRALDGSLIYFLPQGLPFAAVDFDLAETADQPGAGLLSVDHIAQALPEGMLDSWVLFYRSVLGLEPEPTQVLADPYGLVRSRALASPNRSLRVPLNISVSRNTATARSVSTFAGAGVHHVALSTSDIFASAASLRQAGMPMLPIPDNYYDDLAARFDLAPELLDRLRAGGILYDRIDDGEFLHIYTRAFQDRFFFELVQRVGGYESYGAANAPVRMAAQAQLRAVELPV